MYANIDRSKFQQGEYVGYSTDGVYRIRRLGRKQWVAECSNVTSGRAKYHRITSSTLRFIAERLAIGIQ